MKMARGVETEICGSLNHRGGGERKGCKELDYGSGIKFGFGSGFNVNGRSGSSSGFSPGISR